ncbi:hypothetical protein [Pseudomonas asiatica]|uniref:hypothetical protein n=1 Tax=Pseudomonas asiatica TaxID=2219225 RepID=UPI00148570F5|nr:hypothetical protein [Pseudomonas asiatica]EKT4528313.1 hypothetical protein [Pseudomonas putida]
MAKVIGPVVDTAGAEPAVAKLETSAQRITALGHLPLLFLQMPGAHLHSLNEDLKPAP